MLDRPFKLHNMMWLLLLTCAVYPKGLTAEEDVKVFKLLQLLNVSGSHNLFVDIAAFAHIEEPSG